MQILFAVTTIIAAALGSWVYYGTLREQARIRRSGMGRMQGIVHFMYVTPQQNMQQRAFFHDFINPGDGRATLSWRVIVLNLSDVSPSYRETWNSPANREWGKNDDHTYHVKPNAHLKGLTQMFALAGASTAFTEYGESKGRNFLECEPDAILLIDCQNDSIHWMQPGDVQLDELLAQEWDFGIGAFEPNFPEGFLVAFADGAVWCIRRDVPREAISKFFTVESARLYDRDKILSPYAVDKRPPLSPDDRRFELLEELEKKHARPGASERSPAARSPAATSNRTGRSISWATGPRSRRVIGAARGTWNRIARTTP
jgi:hypothetical protein